MNDKKDTKKKAEASGRNDKEEQKLPSKKQRRSGTGRGRRGKEIYEEMGTLAERTLRLAKRRSRGRRTLRETNKKME